MNTQTQPAVECWLDGMDRPRLRRPLESWGPHTDADQIDHCGACGAEHAAGEVAVFENGADVCPTCGAENMTISTWGEFQHDRYRTGERYENCGPQRYEDGPQPAKATLNTKRPNAPAHRPDTAR